MMNGFSKVQVFVIKEANLKPMQVLWKILVKDNNTHVDYHEFNHQATESSKAT